MKRLLCCLLALQFLAEPFVAAQPWTSTLPALARTQAFGSPSYKNLLKDPLIEAFEHADQIPLELGLAPDDPSLDEDPFFLKSQNWRKIGEVNPEKKDVSVLESPEGVTVNIPAAKASWKLNLPLRRLVQTDEYIFFTARDDFQGFDKASKGLSSAGEGVFFIAYDELLSASSRSGRVPVYFFPLNDGGWKESTGLHFLKDDVIILTNREGETSAPITPSQIRDVLSGQRFNLMLAHSITLARKGSGANQVADLRDVLPDAGITAGFGMLFTGINKESPLESLFAVSSPTTLKGIGDYVLSFVSKYGPIPKAEAADLNMDPKLISRLIRVGVVVGFALGASVLLKHFAYKSYFKERNSKNKSGKGRIRQEISDVGDVFAHTLTTFSQFAAVWFANGVEFLGDRLFPSLAAGRNTLVRKFLDKTVYFVRGINERVPVSGRTWLFGAVALGGIDTFFVAIQLYAVVPWMANGLAGHFPFLASRVNEAFPVADPEIPGSVQNDRIASLNQNEVIRNAASYLSSGASSFASDLQAQLLEKVRSEVREKMRNEGKDPEDSQNVVLLNRLIDERLNLEMVKMGLPSKENFIFDASSLYFGAMNLLGYSVEFSERNKNPFKPLGLESSTSISKLRPEEFTGYKRPGVVISAMKESLRLLQSKNSLKPLGLNDSDDAQVILEAVQLLKKQLLRMQPLVQLVTNPIDALVPPLGKITAAGGPFRRYWLDVREARQNMMVYTYNGDIKDLGDFLPPDWKGASPEGVQLAVSVFRDSLSKMMEGPKKEVAVYEPPKKDHVARWQEAKAIRMASDIFLMEQGHAFNASVATSEEIRRFKEIYSRAVSNVLGLYPDFHEKQDAEDKVLKKSEEYTLRRLEAPEIQEYLGKLSREEAIQFEAEIHADNYVKVYLEEMVTSGDLPATSPSQPGRFQKFRQRPDIRGSTFKGKLMTRVARSFESAVAGDDLRLGRAALLNRNIPGWHDFKKSNVRTYLSAITRATASYWFNYYVWGQDLSAAMWSLNLVTMFAIGAPSQLLNRFFAYQGWKPMGKVGMMGLFAVVYTWATFWGAIPSQIFAGDFERAFHYVFSEHLIASLLVSSSVVGFLKFRQQAVEKIKEKVRDFKEGEVGFLPRGKGCRILLKF